MRAGTGFLILSNSIHEHVFRALKQRSMGNTSPEHTTGAFAGELVPKPRSLSTGSDYFSLVTYDFSSIATFDPPRTENDALVSSTKIGLLLP